MIRSVIELRKAVTRGESFRYLYFWGHRPRKDGGLGPYVLSQWWPASFQLDGQRYISAVQWMMAEKARLSRDVESEKAILAASSPQECKALGRQARGFDEASWAERRFAIVVRGNVAKFGQGQQLRGYLRGTGDAVLAEASPTDRIWGIGSRADDTRARDPRTWQG